MCKTNSLVGSSSEISFAEETGALSSTTKTGTGLKPLNLWGRAQSWSVLSMAGWLHGLVKARGNGN